MRTMTYLVVGLVGGLGLLLMTTTLSTDAHAGKISKGIYKGCVNAGYCKRKDNFSIWLN
jgi:hypothetical protein